HGLARLVPDRVQALLAGQSPARPFHPSLLRKEHGLRLRVVLEGGHSELAPEAALLDAAEGRLEEDAAATVDRKNSRFDRARHAHRAPEVPRVERAREP